MQFCWGAGLLTGLHLVRGCFWAPAGLSCWSDGPQGLSIYYLLFFFYRKSLLTPGRWYPISSPPLLDFKTTLCFHPVFTLTSSMICYHSAPAIVVKLSSDTAGSVPSPTAPRALAPAGPPTWNDPAVDLSYATSIPSSCASSDLASADRPRWSPFSGSS